MRHTDLLRWGAALGTGLAWGAAPPTPMGSLLVLAGACLAPGSLAGRPGPDALRGSLAGLVAAALLVGGLPGPGPAGRIALVVLQASWFTLGWLLWSLARRAGLSLPLAALLGGMTAEALAASIQVFPAGPALLLAGAPLLLGPAFLGGHTLLAGVLLAWGAIVWEHPRWAVPCLTGWILLAALPSWWARPGPPTTDLGLVHLAAEPGASPEEQAEALLAAVDLAGARGADQVVAPAGAWPWSATTGRDPGPYFEARIPVLLGAPTGPDRRPARSLLVLREGAVHGRFDQRILLPVVHREVLGWGADRLAPGHRGRWLELGPVLVGPLLGTEDLFGDALRDAHRAGVGLLVAAPRGDTGRARSLHLAAARMAAVTTGRWVARPTIGGTSALVDPAGRIAWHTDAVGARIHVARVPLRTPLWCGTAWSPWLALAAALALVGTVIADWVRTRDRGVLPS